MSEDSSVDFTQIGKFIVDYSAVGSKKNAIRKHNTFSSNIIFQEENRKISSYKSYGDQNKLLKGELTTIEEVVEEPATDNTKGYGDNIKSCKI